MSFTASRVIALFTPDGYVYYLPFLMKVINLFRCNATGATVNIYYPVVSSSALPIPWDCIPSMLELLSHVEMSLVLSVYKLKS